MNSTDKKAFSRRRRELMRLMEDGLAIIPTAPTQVRSRDTYYRFRADSDFYYLTGFAEPEAVAVLVPGRPQGEFLLFCRERDPEREAWDGQRAGLDGAREIFGADDAFPIADIADIVPGLLENREKVFAAMGRYPEFDQRLLKWVNDVRSKSRAGVSAPAEFVELSHLLHELRLVKKPEEIKRMRRAARIAALAHIRAMRACLPGMTEYQIQAELEYEFLRGGAEAPAYESIVAGGANACVLHYVDNRMELKDGELLLIDAGCEVDCYASDITRTFPVNGRFSGEQRAVYEVVLASQKAAIDVVKAGAHWNEPHEAAVAVLTDGLRELGILKGDTDGLIEKEAYKDYYWHRTGHWLGMDVHDVGDYKVDGEWRVLEPGMVLTVEPGLYITEGSKADERWWNIGIRIEDDALVTTGAADILSSDAPKAPVDVEALVGSGVQ